VPLEELRDFDSANAGIKALTVPLVELRVFDSANGGIEGL
jgi:hypothetical protein